MSICLLPTTYSLINLAQIGRQITICIILITMVLFPIWTKVCKLFSRLSKPIHALLASKRCLIGLQKVPFKTLTNALLKSN